MRSSKKCRHCDAVIDHLTCTWWERRNCRGTCELDGSNTQEDDSEHDDDGDYDYSCPECHEAIVDFDEDLLDAHPEIPEAVQTPTRTWAHGTRLKCTIQGINNVSCAVTIENGIVYLCQNAIQGDQCNELQGYNYSWNVGDGSDADLRKNDVHDVVVLSPEDVFNNPQPSNWVV